MISKYNNTRANDPQNLPPQQNTLALSFQSKINIVLATMLTVGLSILALSRALGLRCYYLLCLESPTRFDLSSIDQPLGKKLLLIRLHENERRSFLPNPGNPFRLASLVFYMSLIAIVFLIAIYFLRPAHGA